MSKNKTKYNDQHMHFEFFGVSVSWDHVQGLLQALVSNFPSKNCDLDAYLPSYETFRRFTGFGKFSSPFLMIWGSFSLIL